MPILVRTAPPSRSRKTPAPTEVPLPRAKRTDPPGLPMPVDPRARPAFRRALGERRLYATPQAPFTDDQHAFAFNAAECVVNEVMSVLRLRTFPSARWIDWLCRRAEAYARVSRTLRPRFTGPHDRAWLRAYMRNWLYCGLRKSGHPLADCLPPEMWCGHNPLDHGVPDWRRWRLDRPAA